MQRDIAYTYCKYATLWLLKIYFVGYNSTQITESHESFRKFALKQGTSTNSIAHISKVIENEIKTPNPIDL